jgi:chromosome segregation ATPase
MDWIKELVQLIGAPAVMSLIIVWVFSRRETANAKQDDTITNFSVEFNAERKQLQESNNRMQSEIVDLRVIQARESGRREQLEKSMKQERVEWKEERNSFDDKFRKMETRIIELERHYEQSKLRIQELESQIEHLNKKIAERDATIASRDKAISLLEAQKRELESLLEKERQRAETLSELVTRLQASPMSTTQPIPEDVDDTVITPPPANEIPINQPDNEEIDKAS